jgi:hypothetical protein
MTTMMKKRLSMLVSIVLTIAGIATAEAQRSSARPELTEQQRLRSFSPGGPLTEGVELPPWSAPANPLDDFAPVSDALRANPPPGEWLTWRRTYDDQGFSPVFALPEQ